MSDQYRSDEYLWDRTGEADPEVIRLERVLAEYRYSAPPTRHKPGKLMLAAAAACLALFALGAMRLHRRLLSDWEIAGQRIAVGQTVETKDQSNTKLEAPSFGEVTLDSNSRLQVLPSSGGKQRLALRRGAMHALIWAPPASFLVETPSAKTIDLGCSYTLTVLPDDSGILSVQTGWVAFQSGSLESFIPAGALCHTRPRLGPGLPYFETASRQLRDAVSTYDTTAGREGLDAIVASARKQDALTLWHLVVRTSGRDRDLVVQRFAALVAGVNSAGLRAGNSGAIDQAWNLLGLGGADWWRLWKHDW
jgi:hypothetical protein